MTSRIRTHTQIKRNHDRDALVKFPVESRRKKSKTMISPKEYQIHKQQK